MDRTNVLVVEDDSNWLRIFQTIITERTAELFEYTYVTDLKSALSAIRTNQFGLIVLDLMLPDSHAMDTIKNVSEEVKNKIPIVIITTLDDEKLMANAFQHGIEDYMVKDQYDLETFVHVCRQAISRFFGKWSNSLQQDLAAIISTLQLLDTRLKKMQDKITNLPPVNNVS